MKYKVVFLQQAIIDLDELKNYIIKNFSRATWQSNFTKLKKVVNSLKTFPTAGSIPPELAELNLQQYRQIISGKNRIIYELHRDTVYIHVVCDTRRDMKSLLMRRLLRVI